MKSIFLSTQTTYLLSKEKSNPFAQTVLKNHAFKKWRRNFLCHCCLQRYIVIVNAKTLKRNFFSLIFLILWKIRCHILITFSFHWQKVLMTFTFPMIIWPVAQNIKGFRSGCPIIPKAIGLAQKSWFFWLFGFWA